MATAPRRHGARSRSPQCGFTLVELLVAMALTLLLIVGIGQFFVFITDTVRDGRAIVEMGSDIRNAVRQLREDLNSVTVHPKPPIDDSKGGFLEIVEGVASDADFNGNLTADRNLEIADTNNDGLDEGRMLGDMDDILTMTIRSPNGQPFTGHYWFYDQQQDQGGNNPFSQRMVESHLAEVVWFTTFKDLNSDGNWDPGEPPGPGNDFDGDGNNPEFEEPRFLVRRMFLIAPNIEGWRDSNGNPQFGELVDPSIWPRPTPRDGDNIFQHDDVSLAAPTFNPNLGSNGRWVWKANSLSTLSRRENRFVHLNLDNPAQNGLLAANNFLPNPLQLRAANTVWMKYFTLQHTTLGSVQSTKHGEDLVLPNLLALDIRVYDPQAPLLADHANINNALAALQPGDPGYATAAINNHSIVGYGSYVDLWYNRGLASPFNTANWPIASWPNSSYSWGPDARSLPPGNRPVAGSFLDGSNQSVVCSWDSWTTFYERDGRNQDGDMVTDESTNGLDDDNARGVDDAGEFETRPPYPSWVGDNLVDDDLDGTIDESGSNAQDEGNPMLSRPAGSPDLRGIQVRLRMYEPGTRQTRQATIVADFVEE